MINNTEEGSIKDIATVNITMITARCPAETVCYSRIHPSIRFAKEADGEIVKVGNNLRSTIGRVIITDQDLKVEL